MRGKTHIIGGVTAGAAAQYFFDIHSQDVVFLATSIAGSLIPDICHSGSKLGRKLPLVSKGLSTVFGHRSLTHSFVFLLITAVGLSYFGAAPAIRSGLLIGIISHLILDAVTARGIAFLWPLSWRIRFPIYTNTGSSAERIIAILLAIATVAMTWQEYNLM